MKKTIGFGYSLPLLALVVSLIGLESCQKETIPVEGRNDDRLEELAGRLNKDMPANEFYELSDLVSEKMNERPSDAPQVQADVSNREYQITYSPQVRIEVGGVVYHENRDQLEGGATVNGVYLDPQVFAQLDASAQGDAMYNGLYNINPYAQDYLFLGVAGANGTVGNVPCGAIGLGRVYGKLPPPYSQVSQGEVSYGFIAACGPLAIGASITYYYTGTEIL